MLKIRRPLGRLIFNMGIAIPGKTVFLIETAPRESWKYWSGLHLLKRRVRDGNISPAKFITVIRKCNLYFWFDHLPLFAGWVGCYPTCDVCCTGVLSWPSPSSPQSHCVQSTASYNGGHPQTLRLLLSIWSSTWAGMSSFCITFLMLHS